MVKIDFKKWVNRSFQALIVMFPGMALASGYGDGDESDMENVLNHLISFLTGDIAHLISVIAIIVVGYLWIGTGHLQKKTAISVIGGIALINGGAWLANFLWGV